MQLGTFSTAYYILSLLLFLLLKYENKHVRVYSIGTEQQVLITLPASSVEKRGLQPDWQFMPLLLFARSLCIWVGFPERERERDRNVYSPQNAEPIN